MCLIFAFNFREFSQLEADPFLKSIASIYTLMQYMGPDPEYDTNQRDDLMWK